MQYGVYSPISLISTVPICPNCLPFPLSFDFLTAMSECPSNGSYIYADVCGAGQNYIAPADFVNPLTYTQRITLLTFIAIFVIFSVVSNTCSLATLPRKSYQVLYKGCLISLSISDVVLAVFDGVENVSQLAFSDTRWQFGSVMCSVQPFLTTVCVLASSLTLTLIAVDRFHVLICVNEAMKLGMYGTFTLLFFIWLIAIGASSPMYLYYDYIKYCVVEVRLPCYVYCIDCPALCLVKPEIETYFPALYAIIFLPLLFMFLVSYVMLARHVWKSRQRHVETQANTSTMETNTGTTLKVTHPQLQAPKTDYPKRKLRTFKVILIVMLTFVLCRLPQWTFNLVTFTTPISGNTGFVTKTALTTLTIANTAINPLLYLFLDNVIHVKFVVTKGLRNIFGRFWSFCKRCCTSHLYQVKQ